MQVLYVTYTDLNDQRSGSGLRPACMYQAFLQRGYDVKLLSGSCNRTDKAKRQKAVSDIEKWLQNNTPDFCYIESPTYPIMFDCDYKLIENLHSKHIPTAYFYRDCYRRFPDLFPRRQGFVNSAKEKYLDYLQHKTDRLLNDVDIIYVPSKPFGNLLTYRNIKTLPPAGEDHLPAEWTANHHTCIYAGGISPRYGLDLMLNSFGILNKKGNYTLLLVCRSDEYEKYKNSIGQFDWLKVYHLSGEQVAPLYKQADVGLIALAHNDYNEIAVPIKLYQYYGYGLPVVTTDVMATSQLVEEHKTGLVSKADPQSYADAVRSILDDDNALKAYRQRVADCLMESNLWVHRVDQIAMDLTGHIETEHD